MYGSKVRIDEDESEAENCIGFISGMADLGIHIAND